MVVAEGAEQFEQAIELTTVRVLTSHLMIKGMSTDCRALMTKWSLE
jgi:hypothetical protein